MSATPTPIAPLVLVIDDEPDLRTLYELTLVREGYRVEAAASLAQARQCIAQSRYDAVITDMRLTDGLGLSLLRELNAAQRPERCIVMTAYGSAENAVESLKAGAFDYLTKPVDLKQFRAIVASAIQDTRSSQAALLGLPSAGPSPVASLADSLALPEHAGAALARLVGQSSAMLAVKQHIAKVARSMAPIQVRGESGTGKELVARAVHACSHRAQGPFVAVNCGAIPENLLEAEFFGAKKGSYTGAAQDRAGFFQAAGSGTLFLDEIGDLPLAMQAKLLRAIQERCVRPLGATQEDPVDVRIVSATHKDLAAEVQAGRFRQDLFYRLNVIEIAVPPLRERRGDLPALCAALLARIAKESGLAAPTLSPALLAHIAQLPLDGNVRELENLLHRAVAMGDGEALHLDRVVAPASTSPASAAPPLAPAPVVLTPSLAAEPDALAAMPANLPDNLESWLDRQEREMILRALHESGFNRTAAAAKLGLNLRQIRYRMARLNIVGPGGPESAHDGA